jgi:hypothetical protein
MAVSMKILSRASVLIMLCIGAFAQAQADSVGRSSAGEFPIVQGKGVLTIAGEDYWHRQTYVEGELPALSAYDSSGQVLPDGVYRYELWVFPSGEGSSPRQRDLAKGKGSVASGSSKAKPSEKVSGRFEIQGGELVFR